MDITQQIEQINAHYNQVALCYRILVIKHKLNVFAKVEYSDLEYQNGIFQSVEKTDWYQLEL